jgi:hypothetical protein
MNPASRAASIKYSGQWFESAERNPTALANGRLEVVCGNGESVSIYGGSLCFTPEMP